MPPTNSATASGLTWRRADLAKQLIGTLGQAIEVRGLGLWMQIINLKIVRTRLGDDPNMRAISTARVHHWPASWVDVRQG